MFKSFFYPIRNRLIAALMIALLPLVIIMVIISWRSSEEEFQRANEATRNFALIASGYQSQFLEEMKQLLIVMAEASDFKTNPDTCTRTLNKLSARLNDYSGIAVVNRSGAIACGTGIFSTGTIIADQPYFAQAKRTLQLTISNAVVDKNGHTMIVGAMPWADQNGDLAGMAITAVEGSHFLTSFKNMPLPADSRYFVFDRTGTIIAGSSALSDVLKARMLALPVLTSKPTPFSLLEDNQARTYTSVSVEGGALNVVIGIPRRYFLHLNRGNLLISLLGPLAVLVIVTMLVWWLGNRLVTSPVVALIKAARAYNLGDISSRPPASKSGGEIRELNQTFFEMADRIAHRETELQHAIHRRELMMREIHHRVKNNLQIVISLVNLQSKSVAIPEAQSAFTEIQTRMRALALVHRYLYESDDLQSVNIGSFLTELCSSLQSAYGVSPLQVTMDVIADIVWDISDRAIPLALLMTETVSNALRHAFPENRSGFIHVRLKDLGDNRASFSVEDNGVGIEEKSDTVASPIAGLGMSLIKAFSRQIDGELVISGPPGTLISLTFKTKGLDVDALQIAR